MHLTLSFRHHLQGKVRYKTCLSVFPNGVAMIRPDQRSSSVV